MLSPLGARAHTMLRSLGARAHTMLSPLGARAHTMLRSLGARAHTMLRSLGARAHTMLRSLGARAHTMRFWLTQADLYYGWTVQSDLVTSSSAVIVCWLVGWLTSHQHAKVSQGRICSDNFTCCHTEREVADQTFHLTQSQYTDTGPIGPSADPITAGAWQGSHWSADF